MTEKSLSRQMLEAERVRLLERERDAAEAHRRRREQRQRATTEPIWVSWMHEGAA